jgi:hypothetical protein
VDREYRAPTIEAYLVTEYRIQGEWYFVLMIGQPNEQVAALYRMLSFDSATVLTARTARDSGLQGSREIASQIA